MACGCGGKNKEAARKARLARLTAQAERRQAQQQAKLQARQAKANG